MSTVVSFGTPTKYINAANYFLYGEGGPFEQGLDRAESLEVLSQLGENDREDRFERGYLGALRLAGAVLASQFATRKRVPRGNAWELLERFGGQFAQWAKVFSFYVPMRNRLSKGLDVELSAEELLAFEEQLASFSKEVNEYLGWVPTPARLVA